MHKIRKYYEIFIWLWVQTILIIYKLSSIINKTIVEKVSPKIKIYLHHKNVTLQLKAVLSNLEIFKFVRNSKYFTQLFKQNK